MTKKDFYRLIDEIIEADPGTIKGGEQLADLPAWDSLAVVGFIASMDKNLGASVSAAQLIEAKSVEDLLRLVVDRISG